MALLFHHRALLFLLRGVRDRFTASSPLPSSKTHGHVVILDLNCEVYMYTKALLLCVRSLRACFSTLCTQKVIIPVVESVSHTRTDLHVMKPHQGGSDL